MPNHDDDPDWSLLPQNPQAFFRLADNYDRKTLKRAYNTLIRKFKPERFPEEFQRIRSAFEDLDSQLRYGAPVTAPTEIRFNWSAAPHDTFADASTKAATVSDRIRDGSAAEVYRQLRGSDHRSPYDYFALAVISDTTAKAQEDSLLFFKWLLKGLKEHPGDAGLMSLLRSWIRQSVEDKQIRSVLVNISKVVRDDSFYSLTEPLWGRLLRHNFRAFRELLEQCESNLRAFRIEGRIAFYLHLLKPALFRADSEWLDERFQFVEENVSEVGWFEDEMIFLDQIRQYAQARAEINNGDPIRARMDHAIQAYCLESENEFDRAFTETQLHIARNEQAVFKAFPRSADEIGPLTELWRWLCIDVYERVIGEAQPEADPMRIVQVARRFMYDIEASKHFLWKPLSFTAGLIALGGWTLLPFILLIWLSQLVFSGQHLLMHCLWCLPITAILGYLLHDRVVEFASSLVFVGPMSRREYRRRWRGMTLQCLQRTRLSLYQLAQGIHEIENDDWLLDKVVLLNIVEDPALPIIAEAKVFSK